MKPGGMGRAPAYTEYHPRWYRARVSTYWWLWKWAYTKFVLREVSSIFVAYFVVLTLVQIRCLSLGPGAYAEFQQRLRSPLFLVLNGISVFFVLLHTLTWFHLAPRAVVLRLGRKRVPEPLILAANYLAWMAVSCVVAWLILR